MASIFHLPETYRPLGRCLVALSLAEVADFLKLADSEVLLSAFNTSSMNARLCRPDRGNVTHHLTRQAFREALPLRPSPLLHLIKLRMQDCIRSARSKVPDFSPPPPSLVLTPSDASSRFFYGGLDGG